ncbi:MAG: AAA family ATPase [Chloroflexota bacterium]
MRLLRVALRDYRGVTDRTIELAPTGVTVVEGPNEIGKSSIPEAIDHLFDDLDSSARRELQAVRPVGRDVGPEVVVDVETGPYAFTYRKRYLRQPITELRIHRPRAEQLTGRAAHDRVQAILRETVDVTLWKALRVTQGDQVAQARLGRQTSLSQALDRAAGEAPAGDEEHTLFDAAHAEYLRFWTETGRHRQEEVALERSIEESNARIARIEDAIEDIEADVESSLDLRAESRRLTEQRADLRARAEEAQARVDTLASLQAGVDAAEARYEAARLAAEGARRQAGDRTAAILALEAAIAERDRLSTEAAEDATRLEAARAAVATAEASAASARAERDRARVAVEAAQARQAHARDTAELADLEDRYARGRAANAAMTAAADDAALPVTTELLGAIREQQRAVELARARLEAARPHIRISAHDALDARVDGTPLRLASRDVVERRIDDRLTLDLPGVAAIVVTAGSAPDQHAAELARAEARLTGAARAAGAADLPDAERLHARREDAARTVAEQRRIREGSSRRGAQGDRRADPGASRASRGGRCARHARRPAGPRRARRPRGRPTRLAEAEAVLLAAEQTRDQARSDCHAIELAAGRREDGAHRAAQDVEVREAALAVERGAATDEAVTAGVAAAEAAEHAAAMELATTRAELAGRGLEASQAAHAEAKRALDQVDVEIRLVQDRLLEATTRLRDHGEDGLAEDLADAQTGRDHQEAELRRYQAQAAARRLLFETLREERDRARRSYVGPLRREIERLGRLVFGDGFSVELDESSLEVVNRTLDGRTIPFGSLSVGAQEQIAIIGRLACATIVAPDGGVPVILDDSLGNSDPARLAAMGQVLAAAGEQSQIIVLTCQPGRYAHVEAAKVVSLA